MKRTGEVRPFLETLRELNNGHTLDELAFALNEVVTGVRDHGGAGKLTLTRTVKSASKGDRSALIVTDEIKTKVPKPDNAATVFFPDADNNLLRTNPKQPDLPLTPVSSTASAAGSH